MSLNIYTAKDEIPKDMILIERNDIFFDGFTELKDSELTRVILREVDKAEYATSDTFIGRSKQFGQIYRQNLSTGAKTLLNIISYPDKCFNVVECGGNALRLLTLITEGNILWRNIFVPYTGNGSCDMVWNKKKYTDFYALMNAWRYRNESSLYE